MTKIVKDIVDGSLISDPKLMSTWVANDISFSPIDARIVPSYRFRCSVCDAELDVIENLDFSFKVPPCMNCRIGDICE